MHASIHTCMCASACECACACVCACMSMSICVCMSLSMSAYLSKIGLNRQHQQCIHKHSSGSPVLQNTYILSLVPPGLQRTCHLLTVVWWNPQLVEPVSKRLWMQVPNAKEIFSSHEGKLLLGGGSPALKTYPQPSRCEWVHCLRGQRAAQQG